jgi:hypothetical protein
MQTSIPHLLFIKCLLMIRIRCRPSSANARQQPSCVTVIPRPAPCYDQLNATLRMKVHLRNRVMRRLSMRMMAQTHEHMGQMIAYTRMLGMRVPWPDWRPDKR